MQLVAEFPWHKTRCQKGHPYHTEYKEKDAMRCEADCECGTKDRHTHCKLCGQLISIGDWEGGVHVGTIRV